MVHNFAEISFFFFALVRRERESQSLRVRLSERTNLLPLSAFVLDFTFPHNTHFIHIIIMSSAVSTSLQKYRERRCLLFRFVSYRPRKLLFFSLALFLRVR